jgi:predicted transglutaminase-like cysteine proteinase
MGQMLRGRVRAQPWMGLIVAAAFHGSTALATEMATLPAPVPTINGTAPARPTEAWVRFCQQQPRECQLNPAEPALITLTPEIWQTLITANVHVNSTIMSRSDMAHWGVEDRWDYPDDGFGDCEDYQLLKRRLLVQAGLPRRAMRMTVVIGDGGTGHAVMIARTDRGDFVLDNKRDAVLPWTETGYIYVKQEGVDGFAWASLGGRVSPIATANR